MSSNTRSSQLGVLITDVCQKNAKYVRELKIKGLVGIQIDQREVSWVDLNETFVRVANSVDAGSENAHQPWNREMQSPPQNMVREAQVSRPHAPRAMRCVPSPAQLPNPTRFGVPQAAGRPQMRSPRMPCTPGMPSVPRVRRPQVKLQRLPGTVSTGSAAAAGTESQTSVPEDMLPKTSKCNGSDLSCRKMEKGEELKKVNGDEVKSNGNENQERSKDGAEKSPVKVKNLKSLKRANEEPLETPDESTEKNGTMKTGKKKVAKKNAKEMPDLKREADNAW